LCNVADDQDAVSFAPQNKEVTMKKKEQIALFRHGVLGSLISRNKIERGELKKLIHEAASKDYDIPGSVHTRVAEKTIEDWYYKYRREHLDGLRPKVRMDRGLSKLPLDTQETIITLKKENPKRSIDAIITILVSKGVAAKGEASRSSVHRLLKQHGISRMSGSSSLPEEFRSFETLYANQMWFGDVMHGPKLMIDGRMRKVYLVSLMDDASRLITHSAFCLGETALDIEGVLKQAVLKRGLPMKLVIDNGAAYRSGSLKGICARLGIHMVFCRPYAPEGKGKLERWHRTFRNQFLSELDSNRIHDLNDLNTRLWAWLEQVYHPRMHTSLKGLSPLARYQQDLARIRTLGSKALKLDELFYHRVSRKVRRDSTVGWGNRRFEVDYMLAGKQVLLVIDPHARQALRVEDEQGEVLSMAIEMDVHANCQRKRRKPEAVETVEDKPMETNLVEMALEKHNTIIRGDQ
jgi:transposase InsO family protein